MTSPDSGADPHRDDWVPVPLIAKKYDPETRVYFIEFEAPKQLLLNAQYSAMVHDELLRNADRDGLIIEGQVVITERDKAEPKQPETDSTEKRDATTREVLLDPSKEEQVKAEQDAIQSPYKMSKAEEDFRRRMRQNLRETAETAFGFVADAEIKFGEHTGRVNRDAFMEGFYGGPLVQPPKRATMVVHAEALVAMNLNSEPSVLSEETKADIDIEQAMRDIEIPDDLSGLDDTE